MIELAKLQPQELTSTNDSAFITLPPRLLQVLACLLEGATVKEVAKKIGISAHTVQEHVRNQRGQKSKTLTPGFSQQPFAEPKLLGTEVFV